MSEEVLKTFDEDKVSIDIIRDIFRKEWYGSQFPDAIIDFHKKNLISGQLEGHNWHGTMPSFLHRGMQDLVRDCCSGQFGLQELLNKGNDIMKQEYYIVASHDIIEASIIKQFEDVIPPVGGNKSVTDFIFNNIPFDLKVSHYSEKLPDALEKQKGHMSDNDKKDFARWYMENADKERTRKQAGKTYDNWGLNRMYVLVQDPDKWLEDPDAVVEKVYEELAKPNILTVNMGIIGDVSVVVIEV